MKLLELFVVDCLLFSLYCKVFCCVDVLKSLFTFKGIVALFDVSLLFHQFFFHNIITVTLLLRSLLCFWNSYGGYSQQYHFPGVAFLSPRLFRLFSFLACSFPINGVSLVSRVCLVVCPVFFNILDFCVDFFFGVFF